MAVGDFNGDGRLDFAELVTAGVLGVSIQFGNGDGTFQDASLNYAAGGDLNSLAAADFNGDSRLDIAVVGQITVGGVVSVFLNNGDGSFRAAPAYPNGAGSQSLVVGDLKGDGKLDIVTANFVYYFTGRPLFEYGIVESDVEVFLSNGDGTFQPAQTYQSGGAPGRGDGRLQRRWHPRPGHR